VEGGEVKEQIVINGMKLKVDYYHERVPRCGLMITARASKPPLIGRGYTVEEAYDQLIKAAIRWKEGQ